MQHPAADIIERHIMNDFVTQNIATIAAPAALNVDANIATAEPTVETQQPGVQTANAAATSPTPQPVYPEAAPNAVAATDAIVQVAIAAVVPMPMSKQAQRQQLQSKFVPVRCGAEVLASAPVNAECGPRHNGTFEVRFDSPNEVTEKAINTFSGIGGLYFTPNNIDEHPALKKIRNAEDGINLSALMTRAKRPANIDDASWQALDVMWKDVSTVLNHGLAPVQALITRALAEKGVGGAKISKKLGGGMKATAEDKHEVMCQVLDHLNELLAQNATVK